MLSKSLAEKGVGKKDDFSWRGAEVTRLEGFTDAVFAFAVTLLVVSLEVPRTFDELYGAMRNFIAFGLCFGLLMYLWYNHYTFFRRYGLQDIPTVALNGLLLFVVLFYTYPLKFLISLLVNETMGWSTQVDLGGGQVEDAIRADQTSQLLTVYGIGYVAVFLVFAALYYRAYAAREKLGLSALEKFITLNSLQVNLLQVGIGVFSLLLIVVGLPNLSGWAYMLIPVVMTIQGAIAGTRKRHLFNI